MAHAEPELPLGPGPEEPRAAISEGEARFERSRSTIGLVAGPVGFLVVWLAPLGLAPGAHRLAAILTWVVIYWIAEAIPLPATALLGPLLCVVLGVTDVKTAFAPFANPIIFLFIGSFMLARALTVHGLDRRIAVAILSTPWVGRTPFRLLAVTGGFTAALSMWISNTAATAMVFPIAVGLLHSHPALRAGGYATGVMLVVAYGASVGGIGTLIGTPPNLIGVGLIKQQIGVTISFARWMALGVPLMLVMLAVLFALLYGLHRPSEWPAEGLRGAPAADELRRGPPHDRWSAGERNTAAAFGLAVTLWLLPGFLAVIDGSDGPLAQWYDRHVPEAGVAVLAALLLFVLPVRWADRAFTLTWRDAETIDWGTILLFGGGLSLGDLMFKTQLSNVIGSGLAEALNVSSLWAITACAIFLGIVMSELTSNTASATMIIPVVIAIANAAGVSALPPALGACLGASYGFMLPISTPPNAIVYGSGLVPMRRMIRAGALFDVIGFFIIWGGLWLLCPLLGLE
ncbi:MAG: DASS family sodium-coupled anion symporter [Nitrospirae bacterium]|nr:DASS family sodium-coupled anion symporter [Nitrospirota bacterium]